MNRALALLLLSCFVLTATFGGSCKKRKRDPEIESTSERERVDSPQVREETRKAEVMQRTYKRRTPDSGPHKDTEQDCKPEDWTVDDISTKDRQEQAKKVRVYYPMGESLQDVKKLTHDREPVNIELDRQFYDKNLLRENFGYEQGAYQESTPEKLMPNIAIFTPARIQDKEQVIPNLNVINLIGAGFDHEDQPDYQYYLNKVELGEGTVTKFKEGKEEEFKARMKKMYHFAFHHASENGLEYIQHLGVGEGVFGGEVADEVKAIRKKVIDELKTEYNHIKIVCDLESPNFFVPKHLFERHPKWEESMTNDNTLFINAWDPWSMIGNGNKGDSSLDGYWGSVSNMAYLGWSETNGYLQSDEAFIAV